MSLKEFFRLNFFKMAFTVIFSFISFFLTFMCFVTDTELPNLCNARLISLPVYITVDIIGDSFGIGNDVILIASALIAGMVFWYFVSSIIYLVYTKLKLPK